MIIRRRVDVPTPGGPGVPAPGQQGGRPGCAPDLQPGAGLGR